MLMVIILPAPTVTQLPAMVGLYRSIAGEVAPRGPLVIFAGYPDFPLLLYIQGSVPGFAHVFGVFRDSCLTYM